MTDLHGRPILLAHSFFLRYDPKQWRKQKPYPPLATLYAASVMRRAGYRVALFDAMLSEGVDEFQTVLDRVRPASVFLIEDNYNFLTKMCTVRMREAAHAMIVASKRAGCAVFVNSSDASDHPAAYLASGADAVILGEPEPTALDLVRHANAGGWEEVPGLALPGTNPAGVRHTPSRPSATDFDGLPMPAWDLIDVERYRAAWTRAHGRLSLNMVASRGCPYRCNWCAKPLFGSRYVQRSPEGVAEELSHLKEHLGAEHVWFADDIFGLTAEWIHAFAEAVVRRGARVPFTMQSRVNLMKPATVSALVEAGLEEVWLGVESGSQRILDAMDKGTKVAQVRDATRTLKAQGARAAWFIQLGYLGEAWDDIVETRDLIRAERPDAIGVSVSYPLPGTKFYDMVKAQVGSQTNWRDTDDLAMLFSGTFSTPFYKAVRTLLHDEVDGPRPAAETLDPRWKDLEKRRASYRVTRDLAATG